MCSLTPLLMTDSEYQTIIPRLNLPPSYIIHSILKIEMEWYLKSKYDTLVMWPWKKPEILQLFHGTRHACNVWELDDASKLCNNIECGVCGILKFGPLLKMAKTNLAGKYLWFSRSASFVNKYTGPLKPYDDGFKAMFVMDVVYGKKYLKSVVTDSEENVMPRYLVIYRNI